MKKIFICLSMAALAFATLIAILIGFSEFMDKIFPNPLHGLIFWMSLAVIVVARVFYWAIFQVGAKEEKSGIPKFKNPPPCPPPHELRKMEKILSELIDFDRKGDTESRDALLPK